jgi:transposase
MVMTQIGAMDELTDKITAIEQRIQEWILPGRPGQLLMTIPGVGPILGPVIALEIGAVERFPRPAQLASYAGLVPRLIASGGHIRHGGSSRWVNLYLKWAFVEAATCAVHVRAYQNSHISRLFQRLRPTRGRAAMAAPLSLSLGTWLKPAIGSCANSNPIALRVLPRKRSRFRLPTRQRETRLVRLPQPKTSG